MKINETQIELETNKYTWVRCCHCNQLHKITRAYYWCGENKGKKKPLPNLLLCINKDCKKNIWG